MCLMAAALMLLATVGCSLVPPDDFPREERIDIDRYMGAWYVIAHIPPGATKNAYNSIERYTQTEPGRIETVFTYNEGGFAGEQKVARPTGFVIDETQGAVWGMQFFWPIKMEYTISYVDDDYETTIVARSKRDWVWIMARRPLVTKAKYRELVDRVAELGYDIALLRKVPQQQLSDRDDIEPPSD